MTSTAYPLPPGQERPVPPPSRASTVPFAPPGSNLRCETAYTLWGHLEDPKHPPLICVHGGPGATSIYMAPHSLIQNDLGIPIITYDQLGCGKSTHLRSKRGDTSFWNLDLFVAELGNLIKELGIAKYSLLGNSHGGHVITAFAATQPKGLQSMIICNSTAVMSLRAKIAGEQMLALPPPHREAVALARESGDRETPGYKAAAMVYYHQHLCRVDPWPKEFTHSFAALEDDDTVGSSWFDYGEKLDMRPLLRKLASETVPGGMLVVNSKFDVATDEAMMPYFMEPSTKVKWVKFALGGHMLILDETEEFNKAIGEFLLMG